MLGLFADRAIFVFAGQVAPSTAVAGVASAPFAAYAPSPVELAIVVGAVAALALAYTLAERCLPMGEHSGHATGAFLGSASGSDPAASRATKVPSAPAPVTATARPGPVPAPAIPAVAVVSAAPLDDGTGGML
jgi:hypothetical protein